MAVRRIEWRDRRLALTRFGSAVGALTVALLLFYGLWQSVPDRETTIALKRARNSLKGGAYARAAKGYVKVLALVPNSTVAHLGLTCALWHSGEHSAATIELTEALEAGAFAERLGQCGHGVDLSDVFFAAKLGLTDAFAVPRVRGAKKVEDTLLGEPSGTTAEEPDRMLLGACLARRAGLMGAAWDYAGNALESGQIDDLDRSRFLACFGPRERRRAGCAGNASVWKCVMTPTARRAYFRDVALIDGREWTEG